jgi:hypothetical protein
MNTKFQTFRKTITLITCLFLLAMVLFASAITAPPVSAQRPATKTPAPTATPSGSDPTPTATPSSTDFSAASDKAYGWLKMQQDQYTTGLVESFNISGQLANVCFTYDQAVAAIAFKAKGDSARAKKVLDRLQALQMSSGSWYTAYNCSTLQPWESHQHVGPTLWVVLAAHYYGGTTYDTMAKKAIDWTLQFQQADGGVNGGIDSSGATLTWCSTEHNQDAYAAYNKYGYTTQANNVKNFLVNQVWKTDHFWAGRNDSNNPLDVNPWGVLSLGATTYGVSLDYALATHRNTKNGIDAFDFDSDKDDLWFEGTGQMVVAFKAAGRTSDADYFTGQIIKAQKSNGGVPYSLLGTNNGYWTMSKAESVAATGWLIFAIHNVNPFK